jgi:hypothetical protein
MSAMDEDEAVLAETLEALEMPREGLVKWLERSRAFCQRHGGDRRYRELLALYRECLEAIEKKP